MTHSHVWHGSFVCDVTHSYVWLSSFMCDICSFVCDMTLPARAFFPMSLVSLTHSRVLQCVAMSCSVLQQRLLSLSHTLYLTISLTLCRARTSVNMGKPKKKWWIFVGHECAGKRERERTRERTREGEREREGENERERKITREIEREGGRTKKKETESQRDKTRERDKERERERERESARALKKERNRERADMR